MGWLLNGVYLLILVAVAPVLAWRALTQGKYQAGWKEKFFGLVPRRTSSRPCVWLHAVSLGEVNLLGVMLRQIQADRPDIECYITATTLTGFQAAKRRYPQWTVTYCPLDFSWAVRTAVRRIRPQLLILAELELWPQMIHAVRRSGGRVAVVNGRLSPRSFKGYQRLGWFFRRVLRKVDRVLAQTDEYADRFIALGAPADRVFVTGSLKYDGAQIERRNPATVELARSLQVGSGDVIWLAGSTFDMEESVVLEAYRRLHEEFPQLRLILVPRHPERFAYVAELLERSGFGWDRRTALRSGQVASHRILLVDTIGELSAWWGLADIGFVGGSLGTLRGGQNMIEPAAFGVALCFGPNTVNFRDVVENLLTEKAAVVVSDAKQMTEFVRRQLANREESNQLGERARRLVMKHLGATQRSWGHLENLLPRPTKDSTHPKESLGGPHTNLRPKRAADARRDSRSDAA